MRTDAGISLVKPSASSVASSRRRSRIAPQDTLLMFAEIGLVRMTTGHFARIALTKDGVRDATPRVATLQNLLEMVVSRKVLMLLFPEPKDGIEKICSLRNHALAR